MNGYISDLHWQSDWNGYEVGFDDVDVVGLYTSDNLGVSVYLNTLSGEVLEVFIDEE